MQLVTVATALTQDKSKAISEILGEDFPSKNEVKEKITAMKVAVGEIRLLLTIDSEKDGNPISLSILDLARAYRIKSNDGSLLSELISTYFCNTEPIVSLAHLNKSKGIIESFIEKYGQVLQAAAYFYSNKSVLFQHHVGTWLEITFDEFQEKVSFTVDHLSTLASPSATFTSISGAAKVIQDEGIIAESELLVISSFHRSDGTAFSSLLIHCMSVAQIAETLQKFIVCCKIHKFMFVSSDDNFTELEHICERLLGDEGLDLNVDDCYKLGVRIADIIVPQSVSIDLRDRLESCNPTIKFFDVLLHCSSVFAMAKDRMWLGEEGLKNFYNEYSNVSNVFNKSNQSFENEVLDRLEPTIRIFSVVGGALSCCDIASLFELLQDNRDVDELDEIRLVQANICKVQDWFTEGMDDMAAILSKFAMIQESGSFNMYSNTLEESALPKRLLVLQYSRSQSKEESTVTMKEDDVKQFVQYLGFVNHEGDNATRESATKFIDIYSQLSKIKELQEAMLDVGYNDRVCTESMKFAVSGDISQSEVTEWLNKSKQKLTPCNVWLKEVRLKYKYSLLFWIDELRIIFQHMAKLKREEEDIEELEVHILDAVPRLSPLVSQHPECLGLIREYINETATGEMSWLEDVSNLVNICGVFSEDHLPFTVTEPATHKKVMIHEINCSDNKVFAAPLHVLQYIYKTRCPASFEVLDASIIQSSDDIELFLERVLAFPSYTFTIIAVDQLSTNEQEIIAKFLAKYSRSADGMHLHCIQVKGTILHAPPGVELRLWNDSNVLDTDQYNLWLRNNTINSNHINSITVVGGSPGSGKTNYIRGELKQLEVSCGVDTASLYIHEDFCLSKAVVALTNKFKSGTSRRRALHIGFSMASERMLTTNNFFNSFLILQSIYDPSTGSCFHAGMHSYDI